MKSLIAILTACALLSVGAQRVSADGGWAITGKVLTGLFIGSAVARAFEPPPVYYAPPPVVYTQAPTYYTYSQAPVYSQTPVYSQAPVAAPTTVYTQPAPAQVYAQPTPAPVYVQPAPAPVVVYSAPVYAPYPYYYGAPYYGGPLVSFRLGFGGGGRWHRGWR